MKKRGLLLSLLFVLLFGVFSAQDKTSFPKLKSNITLPIRLPFLEISRLVNENLSDLLYEDNSYTDNNNDRFKAKVWRTKPIRLIGGTQNNIIIEIPLRIWAEKGIGTLGIYTYQNTTFEATLYFTTLVDFKNDWTLITKTLPANIKWISEPTLQFKDIKIPITSLIEKTLKEQQGKFCSLIDEKIQQNITIKDYAATAWNAINQNFEISKEYNTWLKITPLNIFFTPPKFYKDAIDITLGLEVYSETYTGSLPAYSPSPLPNFEYREQLAPHFYLQTTAHLSFPELEKISKQQLLDKEFEFNEGKYKVKIVDAKMEADRDKLSINLLAEGDVNGWMTIKGNPIYSPEKKSVKLQNVEFKLKTSNLLHKIALPLFKGRIIRTIENDYEIPTVGLETIVLNNLREALNKSYYKGLKQTGKVNVARPSSFLVSENGLTAVYDIQAQLSLRIDGL